MHYFHETSRQVCYALATEADDPEHPEGRDPTQLAYLGVTLSSENGFLTDVALYARVLINGGVEQRAYRVTDFQRWVSVDHLARRLDTMHWDQIVEHFGFELKESYQESQG